MPHSLAMLTDLYQITMAQGYWKLRKHEDPAIFDLFFRDLPFGGGYAVACGLNSVIEALSTFSFDASDIEYLATLKAPNGEPLFEQAFLCALSILSLSVDLDALPEGTLVFPREPFIRVKGPLWECQLLETLLLNLVNFSTLIATKAARVCWAAKGDKVIEFGLRRAQGPDGGLTASRSAFVGGIESTSNVLAGFKYGIPIVGTHAHSWVMSFEEEYEAFLAYAKTMPNNVILLVDTYNTLEGVKRAIQVGLKLKESGHALLGIRLDSGDLATLSIQARALLDKAGFKDTKIVGSSDLDEYVIETLKKAGACISVWGVGTKLVTGFDQPALGGIYKMVAIKNANKSWQYTTKTTDDPKKKTTSGVFAIRRFTQNDFFVRDELYDICIDAESSAPLSFEKEEKESYEDLLMPIFRKGKLVYKLPSLFEIQTKTKAQLKKLPDIFRVLKPDDSYPVVMKGSKKDALS